MATEHPPIDYVISRIRDYVRCHNDGLDPYRVDSHLGIYHFTIFFVANHASSAIYVSRDDRVLLVVTPQGDSWFHNSQEIVYDELLPELERALLLDDLAGA
ncbi:MAG: hypothetical protein AB7L09_02335 [Nitrospira sp.]